jgi:hypothetical protein
MFNEIIKVTVKCVTHIARGDATLAISEISRN